MDKRYPIRAAVLHNAAAPLTIETLYLDRPEPDEVRVKVDAVGVCHSDLHYVKGSLPIETPVVLGHEVAGEVIELGSNCKHRKIGEKVVVSISPSCGVCMKCVAGSPTLCLSSSKLRLRKTPKIISGDGSEVFTLGSIGGFAEQVVIRESSLVPVEKSLDQAEACLLACSVETGFGAVTHGAKVSPLDTAAVIGCGGVGISVIQALKISGVRKIIAIDLFAEKLVIAKQFGATHLIQSNENTIENVNAIVAGGVSVAFEAVGRPESSELAFNLTASQGKTVILGLQNDDSKISIPASKLIEGDRQILGAYMGSGKPALDVPALIDHSLHGQLNLTGMVTSRWDLSQINEAFENMKDPKNIRGVITF